jgi:hypothetical protein
VVVYTNINFSFTPSTYCKSSVATITTGKQQYNKLEESRNSHIPFDVRVAIEYTSGPLPSTKYYIPLLCNVVAMWLPCGLYYNYAHYHLHASLVDSACKPGEGYIFRGPDETPGLCVPPVIVRKLHHIFN